MKAIYCLLAIVLIWPKVNAQTPTSVTGSILSAASRTPLDGAAITLLRAQRRTISRADGGFSIPLTAPDTLLISFTGFVSRRIAVTPQTRPLTILLEESTEGLNEVIVSTGYEQLSRQRTTGSFNVVDRQLISRSASTSITDRIENLVPGVAFNRQQVAGSAAPDPLLIRGRGTIYASAAPLIVVDNFAYDGDITMINPDDVESITVLKDAAAAAIWGARAGNGVIVITTKKGKTEKPSVVFSSAITTQARPDIFNIHTISSTDYIELEKFLYGKGFYNNDISNTTSHPPLTPVVELLAAKAAGTVSPSLADAAIENFKQFDARNDISRYLYRPLVNQQYHLQVSANTSYHRYFFSAGYDHNLPALAGQSYDRITLRSQNTFRISAKLEADANIVYAQSISNSGNNPGYNLNNGGGKALYPYAQLADASGAPLSIVENYRAGFIQSALQKGLLDWSYTPITDIQNESNTAKSRDFVIAPALRYQVLPGLQAEVKYQFENILNTNSDLHNGSSFFARNIINQYTQVSGTGVLTYPVPVGGVMDQNTNEVVSHQGRAQLNYAHRFHREHQLSAIAGAEIRDLETSGNSYRYYGYQPDKSIVVPNIDFVTQFPLFNNTTQKSQVPNAPTVTRKSDRFLSAYANASYTFRERYTVSASARHDEANLFGVSANQRGTPLWSAGAAWLASGERGYHVSWLPFLKVRASYGKNGNISRLTSALTTANFGTAFSTAATNATINNPPDAQLRWEQVGILNLGIDFALKNKFLSGTIEYYRKDATDLLGQAPIDPSSGLIVNGGTTSFFYGNVAAMRGQGVDLQLTSHNLNGRLQWNTDLVFSYSYAEVSKYLIPAGAAASTYLPTGGNLINPVTGRPVYSLYSYRWAGLDPATGDPQGFLNGAVSKNYSGMSTQKLDSLAYSGPVLPTYQASLRNSFSWKHFSFSFLISFKGGYSFRKPALNYASLFSSWTGNSDYAKRWQQPGDEKNTSVPSLVYPSNAPRDAFYQYAQVMAEPGDHIRLEDVTLAYDLTRNEWHSLPFSSVRLYVYASQLGILWAANHDGIDPNYIGVPKDAKRISFGMNINF